MEKRIQFMKVFIGTVGSRGDVQSVLALFLELRARGHDVLLAGPRKGLSGRESWHARMCLWEGMSWSLWRMAYPLVSPLLCFLFTDFWKREFESSLKKCMIKPRFLWIVCSVLKGDENCRSSRSRRAYDG